MTGDTITWKVPKDLPVLVEMLPIVGEDGETRFVQATPDLVTPPVIAEPVVKTQGEIFIDELDPITDEVMNELLANLKRVSDEIERDMWR